MKKLVAVAVVAALGLGMAGTAQPAFAGGWHHRGHHHHGDFWLGAGVALTGLAVLDAVLGPRTVVYAQPPVVYGPPPVAYTPPVVYAPAPVVYSFPVVVAPPPVVCRPVYLPPPVVYRPPVYYGGYWGPRPGYYPTYRAGCRW